VARIAFLSEHASPLARRGGVDAGGQNVYVDEVSRNLAALGHEVDIFVRRDDPSLPEIVEQAPGVRIVHLAAGPATSVFKDELWPYMPDFRDELLAFARRSGTIYDLIHGNFWMSGWVGVELKRELGIPLVQIFHAMGKTKRRHQGGADTSPGDRIAVEMEIIAAADCIIAQCPAERHELLDDYDADPARVVVIPSAVNTDLYAPVEKVAARRIIGIEPDALNVVYVGRMLPRKDIRNVVRAMAHLTDLPVTLLLVGGETAQVDREATPEIGVLQDLSAELSIADRVRFFGKRQPNTLRYYYSAGDVAVTTPWYEPFGLTPLEAMACARPVVGSAVGGITFTIQDGVTGYLVPPKDPVALAGALRRLLADAPLREEMGRAARERVEREFTWRTVAERTSALYRSLLTGHDGTAFGEGDMGIASPALSTSGNDRWGKV
jgi:D-inositol-3-phosphate glycosyltransferase